MIDREPPSDPASVAREHVHVRSEIDRLTARLAERLRGEGAPTFARELAVLEDHLLAHFEHEELSWSALAERIQDPEYCAWTARFTAEHRAFALRARELVLSLAEREHAGLSPRADQAARLAELFEDLLRHERGEGHLLARLAGWEDEGGSER
ncbi:MAG: hypothetical protein U1F29_10230 [Planctomycetota bacterium]